MVSTREEAVNNGFTFRKNTDVNTARHFITGHGGQVYTPDFGTGLVLASFVRAGVDITAYGNGEVGDSATATGYNTSAGPTQIGVENDGQNSIFNGDILEVVLIDSGG